MKFVLGPGAGLASALIGLLGVSWLQGRRDRRRKTGVSEEALLTECEAIHDAESRLRSLGRRAGRRAKCHGTARHPGSVPNPRCRVLCR